MRVVIIGGDAAGMSAASQVKRLRPDYDVVLFERGGYISYAACGIPYFVGKAVGSLDDLIEVLPDEAREKRGIDLRLGHTAVAIDPSGRTVTVEHEGQTTVEPYDSLLIATGARAQTLGIDMGTFAGVFAMNDLSDARKIADYAAVEKPETAAVIGGGYIGLEAVESFCGLGLKTTLVHRREDLHRSFEKEMSDIIKQKLTDKGVALSLGKPFSGLEHLGGGVGIVLGEESLEADMVLLALGVEPNSRLAAEAG